MIWKKFQIWDFIKIYEFNSIQCIRLEVEPMNQTKNPHWFNLCSVWITIVKPMVTAGGLVTSVDGTHYIKADDNYSWLYHSLRRECLKGRCFFKIFFIKKIIKINFNKKKLNSLPREVVAARIAKVLLAN